MKRLFFILCIASTCINGMQGLYGNMKLSPVGIKFVVQYAAERCNIDLIQSCLKDSDVILGDYGAHAILELSENPTVASYLCIRTITEHGANLNFIFKKGVALLNVIATIAQKKKDTTIFKLLLEKGANPDQKLAGDSSLNIKEIYTVNLYGAILAEDKIMQNELAPIYRILFKLTDADNIEKHCINEMRK